MCVVSMIGDDWRDRWNKRYPSNPPWQWPTDYPYKGEISREEFEKLENEIKILKEQLKRAKQYDKDNNEPDCEVDDKMEKLKKVAKIFDIDLDEVLKNV